MPATSWRRGLRWGSDVKLLDIDQIAAMFRVNRRTVAEKWIQQPGFPAPRYAPTRRCRLWDAADVETWATPSAARSEQAYPGSRHLTE